MERNSMDIMSCWVNWSWVSCCWMGNGMSWSSWCMSCSVYWCSVTISKMCIDVISVLVVSISVVGLISMMVVLFIMMILSIMRIVMRCFMSEAWMIVVGLPVTMVLLITVVIIAVHCVQFMISHFGVAETVVVVIMVIHWLHFQDQITARCVNIRRIENGGICLKSTGSLVPSATVECIKIVSPVKQEFSGMLIIVEDLNIVIKHIPWHVYWVKSISPRVEGWRPEVHS